MNSTDGFVMTDQRGNGRITITVYNTGGLLSSDVVINKRFRPSTTNTTSGAHGGIVQSRMEIDLILTDFDKDEREAIVSLPRKMLVKYTAGNDCQHQKSSTIFNNKKYTEENSV
ncbi:hypothetical protein J6590_040407 [Homalodisca vitripennis]|nr:hypothetical protein J6590_040407 [Homalodisca vitripennis]